MVLQEKLDNAKEKLYLLCAKNHFECDFKYDRYPIIFRITHERSMAEQVRLNETGEPPPLDPDAALEIIFGDDTTLQVYKSFEIDDDLLNTIKSHAKKLHYIFLQDYFALKMRVSQQ